MSKFKILGIINLKNLGIFYLKNLGDYNLTFVGSTTPKKVRYNFRLYKAKNFNAHVSFLTWLHSSW